MLATLINVKATGYKSLYMNPAIISYFEGLRHEESEYLMRFLTDYVVKSGDFHARYKWSEGDVCVWDQVCEPLRKLVGIFTSC